MRRRWRRGVAAVSLTSGVLALCSPPLAAEILADRSDEIGLEFRYFNGMSGELYFPETMGGGVALFDYDLDGDLDLFFPQGAMLGEAPVAAATIPPPNPPPLVDHLFRNDLVLAEETAEAAPRVRLTEVTEDAGFEGESYGMGVAVGDYDNDGFPDLYVTNFGPNELWRNRGDGTFERITEAAGVEDDRWTVPAVFLDYDADGWLDLFAGNYVDFRIAIHKPCTTATGALDYCGPDSYAPLPDRLWRNRGDGSFEDVSRESGIRSVRGPALGAVSADFDGDGRLDLYVANDRLPNRLWTNRGEGEFVDDAVLAGVAVNREGQPEASMGVVAEDLDRNGAEDLFVTHLNRETNTLYLNDGSGLFEDRSQTSGLAMPSWPYTGFGIGPLDVDLDGRLDLFVANGEVRILEEQLRAGVEYPLRQTNQLFRNLGAGRFEEVGEDTCAALAVAEVSRGVATGDVDLDGDEDLVVVNNSGPATYLENIARRPEAAAWLGVAVTDEHGRDALGAEVVVRLADGERRRRRVRTDGSYASANDPRLLFGLGGGEHVDALDVRWLDGLRRRLILPPRGRYVMVLRRAATGIERGDG